MPASVIKWHDLMHLTRVEIVRESLLPLPFFACCILAWQYHIYSLAILCSFYCFLALLRLAHGAFHYALGIGTTSTHIVLFCTSVVQLGSNHAIQVSHLLHHKHTLQDGDAEGFIGKLNFGYALLFSPVFPIYNHYHAVKNATNKQQIIIGFELTCTALQVAYYHCLPVFWQFHMLCMLVGHGIVGMVAVWSTHRDLQDSTLIARTQDGWVNDLFLQMFFHLEHHMFPRVPTCKWYILAQRMHHIRGNNIFRKHELSQCQCDVQGI